MLIGIDVGGTFTDGVLFDNGSVIASIKRPTDDTNLKDTLLAVLDELLKNPQADQIERLVLSTTLVTNILATGSGEETALLLIPGPGLPYEAFNLFEHTFFLDGCIDFRGRELQKVNEEQIIDALKIINTRAIKKIAVVGKFSNRNSTAEKRVREIILDNYPEMEVYIGSEVAGQLNFMRRMVTTYYSAMTGAKWRDFVDSIEAALRDRGLECRVDVLKADGGTMSLDSAQHRPCETIFSGPAASTMGAVALRSQARNSVVLDIGGTTTDISLLIDGKALYASKGASIDGHFTHVNSFSVCSVAIGGDSPVTAENDTVNIHAKRQGPAACFGGSCATLTDVFNYLYKLELGDERLSKAKLLTACENTEFEIDSFCELLIQKVSSQLESSIKAMFKEWENEPAYRVWEVVNDRSFQLDEVIGIGAAAAVIVPVVAQRMQLDYFIHDYSPVANALGACVARPTISFNLHVDTQRGEFNIDREGISGKLDKSSAFQLEDARELARRQLNIIAAKNGIEGYAEEAEFFQEEQFNMIRAWDRTGKIFEIGIQISPSFIDSYKGVSK